MSAAHVATGNRASKTAGPAPVAMSGTRLTQAEFVQNAKSPGSKPNVYAASNGHGMMIGMCGKKGKEKREDEQLIPKA